VNALITENLLGSFVLFSPRTRNDKEVDLDLIYSIA